MVTLSKVFEHQLLLICNGPNSGKCQSMFLGLCYAEILNYELRLFMLQLVWSGYHFAGNEHCFACWIGKSIMLVLFRYLQIVAVHFPKQEDYILQRVPFTSDIVPALQMNYTLILLSILLDLLTIHLFKRWSFMNNV